MNETENNNPNSEELKHSNLADAPKEFILSVKLDFPIKVSATITEQDAEYFLFSFQEEELLNKIRETLQKDCYYQIEKRKRQ